jgi:hypothetical protein
MYIYIYMYVIRANVSNVYMYEFMYAYLIYYVIYIVCTHVQCVRVCKMY